MKTIKTVHEKIRSETGSVIMLVWTPDDDLVEIKDSDAAATWAERLSIPVETVQLVQLNIESLRDAVNLDLKNLHKRLERLENERTKDQG